MRRIGSTILIVILLSCVFSTITVQKVRAVATWIVDDDGPADFHTIQEAVNVAGDGDIILVKQGTYYEEVNYGGKHSLEIVAENQNAVVDGKNTGRTFFIFQMDLGGSENVEIRGFTIQNGSLVDEAGTNTVIRDNLIRNVSIALGFEIPGANGWVGWGNYNVTGNVIEKGGIGVWGCYAAITNNLFKESGLSAADATLNVTGNLFERCETAFRCGVAGQDVSGVGGEFKDNRIFLGNIGLFVGDYCTLSFENNHVWNNHYGIYLGLTEYPETWGTFFNNTIEDNDYGFYLGVPEVGSSGYMIVHGNRFIDNAIQAYVPMANHEQSLSIDWNTSYPEGGNYWSDYQGTDLYQWPSQTVIGPDGIGDTPYVVGENNIDYYPLMPPRFGKIDVGTSRSNLCQYMYGSRYQAPENGVGRSTSLYVEEMSGQNTALEVALYNDNAGKPGSLLAQGTSTVPAGYQNWMTVQLSTRPNLSSGSYYWLVADAIASGKTLRFAYSAGTTNQAVYGNTGLAVFPTNPCVYLALNARAYSIHCNYQVAKSLPPFILSHVPAKGAVDVGVIAKVQVNFTERMNQASLQSAFSVTPSVQGSFSWSTDGAMMTFTPNSNLAYGTSYAVTISSNAKDMEGQNMPSSYSWDFTTEQSFPKFGKVDVGSSRSNLCSYLYGSRYQMPEYGTAQSIALYVEEINGLSTALEVAIYNDSSGTPTGLLAQGATTVAARYSGWITVALSTHPQLVKNNYYWLVADAIASGKALRIEYSTATTNQAIYGSTGLASFPTNPCSYSGFKTRAYSIYCNYVVSPPISGTFGKLDTGAYMSNVCQYSYGSRFQISQNGIAQSITFRVWEMNGENKPIKVALYSDNAGKPASLLATGTGTVPAGINGSVTIDLATHPSLSAGSVYWLVVNAQSSGKSMRMFYSTGTVSQSVYDTTNYASFPVNPCEYAGFKDRAYSIYCNYFLN